MHNSVSDSDATVFSSSPKLFVLTSHQPEFGLWNMQQPETYNGVKVCILCISAAFGSFILPATQPHMTLPVYTNLEHSRSSRQKYLCMEYVLPNSLFHFNKASKHYLVHTQTSWIWILNLVATVGPFTSVLCQIAWWIICINEYHIFLDHKMHRIIRLTVDEQVCFHT